MRARMRQSMNTLKEMQLHAEGCGLRRRLGLESTSREGYSLPWIQPPTAVLKGAATGGGIRAQPASGAAACRPQRMVFPFGTVAILLIYNGYRQSNPLPAFGNLLFSLTFIILQPALVAPFRLLPLIALCPCSGPVSGRIHAQARLAGEHQPRSALPLGYNHGWA